MKRIGFSLVLIASLFIAFRTAHAQTSQPLVLVMNVDGPIEPAMQSYIERGIKTAGERNAEALIIQLNTPGGSIAVMQAIVTDIRASKVPVVVYVAPRGAWAGSAGSVITLAGHVAAMAPETMIGAASPVGSGGTELDPTIKAKETEALTATVRSLTERRGPDVTKLAESMITCESGLGQRSLSSQTDRLHCLRYERSDQTTRRLHRQRAGRAAHTSHCQCHHRSG